MVPGSIPGRSNTLTLNVLMKSYPEKYVKTDSVCTRINELMIDEDGLIVDNGKYMLRLCDTCYRSIFVKGEFPKLLW